MADISAVCLATANPGQAGTKKRPPVSRTKKHDEVGNTGLPSKGVSLLPMINSEEAVFFSVRPIVLSLAFSTMFNSTTFSSSRRRLQRANPSGAGEPVRAINLASAAPSKIRGRAEFGLYLRFSVASNPSSTSCCRVRETVLMLVSSAAEIALSLQPSPPSDTSAFSRMRAFVSSCAELLPARINASSRSRSSMVNFTTYFLPAISFPATNHLHRCIAATEIQRNTSDSRTRATSRPSHTVVGELLKGEKFSLQANRKTREGDSHPDRDAQFAHINASVSRALAEQQPVISVDTKKKELVGDFKNGGREWRPQGDPEAVRVHDFLIKGLGRAVPYGIYDLAANAGWVSVGIDHDTAEFAVQTIRSWWHTVGCKRYPNARHLTITADGGGSNGSRVRLWKRELQRLANELGIDIHVHHLPPGTS